MAGRLDPGAGQPHSGSMIAAFDTLAAADALRAVGMESDHARAIATQLRAAAGAGDAVTRSELEAALARFKTELLGRMSDSDQRMADTKSELLERIAEGEQRTADLRTELLERIALSERHHAVLLWRLFAGIAAVVAAAKYLP